MAKKTGPAAAGDAATPSGRPHVLEGVLLSLLHAIFGIQAKRLHEVRIHREHLEMVISVVMLVTLLRTFAAEAFVIPTGSMAPTLYGAHKSAVSPISGYRSPFNASQRPGARPERVMAGFDQNSRTLVEIADSRVRDGDRVLVGKYLFDGFGDPQRWQVIVFKCPDLRETHVNYIKRMIGMPNEELRLYYGDILVRPAGSKEPFTIARKPPRVIEATRRMVYDDAYPARDHLILQKISDYLADKPDLAEGDARLQELLGDLRELGYGAALDELRTVTQYRDFVAANRMPPRWQPADGKWTIDAEARTYATPAEGSAQLAYQHLIGGPDRIGSSLPQIVTDFESYNTSITDRGLSVPTGDNWVGDLMAEFSVDLPATPAEASRLWCELGEGTRRYRLTLAPASGTLELSQDGKPLAEKSMGGPLTGKHSLFFANVDDRLVVWLDGGLAFGEGVDLAAMSRDEQGPAPADLRPVMLGTEQLATTFSALKIYRDIYYLKFSYSADYRAGLAEVGGDVRYPMEADTPELLQAQVARYRRALQAIDPASIEYSIPAESYMMLGDNSPSSRDSREWDARYRYVHREMILGRALAVFWPFWNWKFIH